MNRVSRIAGICLLLVIAGVFEGCDRNPFKARVHVNRGSGMTTARLAIVNIRAYAERHGHLPKANADLADLGEFSVLPEFSAKLQYGGNDTLSLKSPERLIVLKFVYPVSSANGVQEFYCALLSGEILLLQEKDAILGKSCPLGIGSVVLTKP